MENSQIYGHSAIQKTLSAELEKGDLSHAYLFFGPEGVGKFSLAKQFAKQIANNSPADIFELDLSENGTIGDLRQFLSTISVKPVLANRKVAIINNFELASDLLGNAMLKTLEDPTPSTVIILVSSRQVLPTIISRCRVLSFGRLQPEEIKQLAGALQLNVTNEQILLTAGSPARLIKLFDTGDLRKKVSDWSSKMVDAQNFEISSKLLLISELGTEDTEVLRQVLLAFIERLRQRLSASPQLAEQIRKAMEGLDLLRFNLNKKLVLQRVLL